MDNEEYEVFEATYQDAPLPAFMVPTDSFITGLSFEMHAEVKTDNTSLFDFVATVLIYHSPKESNVFTVVNELSLQLQTVLNGDQITSIYGINNNSNYFVEAGSKIAVALYTEALNPQQASNIFLSSASATGSMTILTN